MKTKMLMTHQTTAQPSGSQPSAPTLAPTCPLPATPSDSETAPGEAVRHILLGSPGAVRQTIHLLHSLGYSETVLWSPVLRVEEELAIVPKPGEAMSLLRKTV